MFQMIKENTDTKHKNSLVDGDYWITDLRLAEQGYRRIEMARADMPGLVAVVNKYKKTKPLQGVRIAVCVIPTDATGNLAWALQELGASVRLCSDNRVSTKDDIAAAMVDMGISVFARRNQTLEQHNQCLREVVKFRDEHGNIVGPHQIIDDGFDLSFFLHQNSEYTDLLKNINGVTEQTTCGINFATGFMRNGELLCPVININSGIKQDFDNRYGTRESFIHSYFQCINIELGGKVVVLVGFGAVGRGVADQLRAVGSRVVIVEADPIRAAQALMEGFQVDSIESASHYGDMFIATTGAPFSINRDHILNMKDGVILANMGENYIEYDTPFLHSNESIETEYINDEITLHILPNGNRLYSLVDGGLLNMRGGGHPPRLLSITFSMHILMQIDLAHNPEKYQKGIIHETPRNLQEDIILSCFPVLQGKLVQLSDIQLDYMGRGNGDRWHTQSVASERVR